MPTSPITSQSRSRSVPLSSFSSSLPSTSASPLSPSKSKSNTRPATGTPVPTNRFGLRDSDTDSTSSSDGESSSGSDAGAGTTPRKNARPMNSARKLLSRSTAAARGHERASSLGSGHETSRPSLLKRGSSQRSSARPSSRARSSSVTPSDPARPTMTQEEHRQQEEFLQAVRLRQRRDPLEEYEEAARRESWNHAYAKNKEEWKMLSSLIDNTSERTSRRIADMNRRQLDEVSRALQQMEIQRTQEEERLRVEHRREDTELRESIEQSIALYEADLRAAEEARQRAAALARQQEEERARKAQQEAEARVHQEELKQKLLEQKKRQQEEGEARRREEERTRKEEEEKEERKRREEREEEDIHSPVSLVFPKSPGRELRAYRELMEKIKVEILPTLKVTKLNPDFVPDPQVKRTLNQARRFFTPKIGQITNVRSVQERITQEIQEAINPPGTQRPMAITLAIQYQLSKAVLKQAEVEVTAKPSTAYPLARVMRRLIEQNPGLGSVFMAKLVKMTGPWIVAASVPRETGQSDDDYRKALGYRPISHGETQAQYIDRMVGLVTLYAAILQTPPSPLPSSTSGVSPSAIHQTIIASAPNEVVPGVLLVPRLWTYIARLLNSPSLMRQSAAPHILNAILETAGNVGMMAYKGQMVKVRSVLMRKCLGGTEAEQEEIGGSGGEGKAGRVRLGLFLEEWARKGFVEQNGAVPLES